MIIPIVEIRCYDHLISLIGFPLLVRLHCVNSSPPSAIYIYTPVNRVSIGSDNGLWPIQYQAISWTNAGLFSTGLLATNFSEIWIGILSFSFKKMHWKMLSARMAAILSRGKWVKSCLVGSQPPNFLSHSVLKPVLLWLCMDSIYPYHSGILHWPRASTADLRKHE